MANPNPLPSHSHRPVAADFVDHHLPNHHPAFMNTSSHYDSATDKYIPNNQDSVSVQQNNNSTIQYRSTLPDTATPLPRPTWTNINALTFWNNLFPEALDKFLSASQEPSGLSKTIYSIRQDNNNWDAIYDALERAKLQYQQHGKAKGVFRKASDNIGPITQGVKIASHVAPSNPYSTPILGAVSILLDAVKTAATVRKQVTEGFDDLISILSDIELFLGTFPGDWNIWNAAVDLTATILLAIERAIRFFTRNDFVRGLRAVGMGDSYEKELLESLGAIKARSRGLLEEATKSQIYNSHTHFQRMEEGQRQIIKGQNEQTAMINVFYSLIRDHEKQKDEALKKESEMQRKITHLTIENERLRSISPAQNGMWAPPPSGQTQIQAWHTNQETLRRMVASPDLDLIDISFANDRKQLFSPKHRAKAEQVVNTQLFRNWIVSARSAKLMVQWDSQPPRTVADISPLSVFCATISQGLRSGERIVSLLWFCGRHNDRNEAGEQVGGYSMLASLIDQLLRQCAFDTKSLCNNFNLMSMQNGEYNELVRLLEWLVRQLPNTTTLFFVIDGVALFERDEHWDQSAPVFSKLLALVTDPTVPAVIKVLFTSTPGCGIIRAAFEQEDLILEVGSLPSLGWAPSEERMARELGESLH